VSQRASIIIPAKNEELNLKSTIMAIIDEFQKHTLDFEIIVVNDGSVDSTAAVVQHLQENDQRIRLINNFGPHGIGNAIRKGLENFKGDYAIITMADASDDPKDLLQYAFKMLEGYDCCFGDRWCQKGLVHNYPSIKFSINRMVNWIIGLLFATKYRDTTNAFKCYSRETIEGIFPILSHHYNITVELPLKAIVRGYKYAVIPTRWYARKKGASGLRLKEMGSRYLFIILYVLLEKLLCAQDYRRKQYDPPASKEQALDKKT